MSQDCATFIDPLLLLLPMDSGGERTWRRASVQDMVKRTGLDVDRGGSFRLSTLGSDRNMSTYLWFGGNMDAHVEEKFQIVQPVQILVAWRKHERSC
jgi:hypothetical protein